MPLAENRESLIESIQENISIAAGNPAIQCGDSYQALSEEFQALGICNFVIDYDTAGLYKNLLFSVYARRFYFRKCGEVGKFDDVYGALSRVEPLFDAIVCQRDDLVLELASLSTLQFMRNGEYEEDFHYYHFIHQLVAGAPEAELASILQAMAACIEANADRLKICEALLKSDVDAFIEGFEALIEVKQEQGEEDPTGSLLMRPRAILSIEAVALLLLAQRCGLGIEEEYALCPKILLTPNPNPANDSDLFLEIETQFAL